jgi:hypothetical protein
MNFTEHVQCKRIQLFFYPIYITIFSFWISGIWSSVYVGVKEVLPTSQPVYEDQTYLQSQTGTTLLDKFTYCLLVKCSAEVHSDFCSSVLLGCCSVIQSNK